MEREKLAQAQLREENDQSYRRDDMALRNRVANSGMDVDRAQIANMGAQTAGRGIDNQLGTQKLNIINGLMPVDEVPGAQPSGGIRVPGNDPSGRLNLELIDSGMANAVHGSVPPPRRPEDLSPEESFYTGEAKKMGLANYRDLPPDILVELRKRWAEEGSRDRQFPTMLVPVFDPSTNSSTWTPRGEAAGKLSNPPAGLRERMGTYDEALDLMDQIDGIVTNMGGKPKGTGPIEGLVDSAALKFLGADNTKAIGLSDDPVSEEDLRVKVSELQALASFSRGGKQFTGTEKTLIDNFLGAVKSGDDQLLARLRNTRQSMQRGRASIGGGATPGPAQQQGINPAAAPPASANPVDDAYAAYLARQKKGGI
jgi:hypothetical protein